ncbi:MAG: ectoine hydroxylase [Halioglobus sp.]
MLPRINPVVYAPDHSNGPISQHLVAQFETQGFFVIENLFDQEETAAMFEEMIAMREDPEATGNLHHTGEPGHSSLRSIFGIHQSDSLFARLAQDARLVEVARFLLHDEVYIHQSRLNFKPGLQGKEFYWHSDFETWHVEDGMPLMRALSASILLTENSSDNGPLMFIPESHHHYVSCEGKTPEGHFKQSLQRQQFGIPPDQFLIRLASTGGITTVNAPPGSVVFFDSNLMHGSNSNITPYPRSNAFIVYNALSNAVVEPFCNLPQRPEFLCTRKSIQPLISQRGDIRHE